MIFIVFLPDMISQTKNIEHDPNDTTWIAAVKKLRIDSINASEDRFQKVNDETDSYTYQFDKTKNAYYENRASKKELFYFDPNTASEADWKNLGLRDKTIKTIINYLDKGGHFYKPNDLQKIYGLHKDEYERLFPYVRIELHTTATKETYVAVLPADYQRSRSKAARYSVLDINTADTSEFIALPGIGSKLASRIINFRDKLGGFYSIEQIGETYGLPDSTFQDIKGYLKLETTSVKKININTATVDELKAHPYIKFSLANPIIAYRNEHGLFEKIEDIKNIMAVTDEVYKKITPYLTLQ